jgi:hypothetical protein
LFVWYDSTTLLIQVHKVLMELKLTNTTKALLSRVTKKECTAFYAQHPNIVHGEEVWGASHTVS